MSEPASISSGVASRYATALFDLAKEEKTLPRLEKDLGDLQDALAASDDLRAFVASPIYTREEMASAIMAVADEAKLGAKLKNTLGLMAQNRRLFVLPAFITALKTLIADHKGEVTAEVITAKALTKAQSEKLAKSLADQVGKTVTMETSVDESLIGGMIVKVGSRMVDTSIRSKLATLQNNMKEAG